MIEKITFFSQNHLDDIDAEPSYALISIADTQGEYIQACFKDGWGTMIRQRFNCGNSLNLPQEDRLSPLQAKTILAFFDQLNSNDNFTELYIQDPYQGRCAYTIAKFLAEKSAITFCAYHLPTPESPDPWVWRQLELAACEEA